MKATKFILFWFLILIGTHVALSFAGAVPAEAEIINGRIIGFFERVGTAAFSDSDPTSSQSRPNLPSLTTGSGRNSPNWETMLPTRVIINKIDVDSVILNPNSTEIAVLDQALSEGVVRYPGSGGLGDTSNMLLFGHSTPLRDVRNQSYQAFNGLDEMTLGDTIEIFSGDTVYIYQVNAVYEADVDETMIDFNSDSAMITISTCDSFGSKSARIVVEAKLVQVLP
jgi:LPXTG-site transpeptidase (sortase) family protein